MLTGELIDTINVVGNTIDMTAWPDTTVCPGTSVQLNATVVPGATYSWLPTTGLDNPNISNPIATVNGITVYVVTADNGTGCTDSDSVTVAAIDTIPPVILNCPENINNGCDPVVFWTPPTATDNCDVTITGDNIPASFFPYGTTTTVTYTAIDPSGNTAVCQFDVTVYSLPVADAGPDTAICPGSCVLLGGDPTGTGGTGTYTYMWTPAASLCADNIPNPIACPDSATTYTVFVIDSVTGCAGTDQVTITFVPPPTQGIFVKDSLRVLMNINGAFAQPLPPGNSGIAANDDHFGFEVDRIDDIDGNGLSEAIIGAPRDNDNAGIPGQNAYRNGAAYIMHFGATGVPTASYKISNSYGNLNTNTSIYLRDRDQFGISVTDMGDVDGDGVRDIAVGAPGTRRPGASQRIGAVHLLYMNTDNTVKAGTTITDGTNNFPGGALNNSAQLVNGTRFQGYFGFGSAVSGVGDWDGDGIQELVVGNMTDDDNGNNRGSIWFLFLDNSGNVKPGGAIEISDPDLAAIAGGNVLNNHNYFGAAVDNIGDVNGDGVDDLIVGAPGDDDGPNQSGAVFILFMNANGTLNNFQEISSTTGVNLGLAPALPLAVNDFFGYSVEPAGDINGDGVPDVWVGDFLDSNPGASNNNRRGAIYLLYLQADGQVQDWDLIDGDVGGNSGVLAGALTDDDYFGKGITTLDDYDGNCLNALLVGAHREDETQQHLNSSTENDGCVWVLHLGDVATGNRPAGNRPDVISTGTRPGRGGAFDLGGGKLGNTGENYISVYPSPTYGLVNIDVTLSTLSSVKTSIEISNLMGQTVLKWEGETESRFVYPADLSDAPAGQYLVNVIADGVIFSAMVIKVD
jgi:hypothetical protein